MGSSIDEEHHRTRTMPTPDFIIADPSIRVVDSAGLNKDVATIDPFAVGTADVFRDGERVGKSVGDFIEPNRTFIKKNAVVLLSVHHQFPVQSAIVSLCTNEVSIFCSWTLVDAQSRSSSDRIAMRIERVREVDGCMQRLLFEIRQK